MKSVSFVTFNECVDAKILTKEAAPQSGSSKLTARKNMGLKWCASKRDNPEKVGKHAQSRTCNWSQCFIIARSSESFHTRWWFEHPRHLPVLEPLTRHKGQHNRLPIDFSARQTALCWPSLWRGGFNFPAGHVTLVWSKPNRESMDYFEDEDIRDQNQHRWRAKGCCRSNMGIQQAWVQKEPHVISWHIKLLKKMLNK